MSEMDGTSSPVPTLTLGESVEIPQLGFGVFQVPPDDTAAVVERAFAAGYRHIDTAAAYRNERGVGEALAASTLPRESVFVTTKCWNQQQGYEASREAFEKSIGRLGFDVLDLYLIHWPAPPQDLYLDTWRTFTELQDEGRVRAIGVSNFQPAHLRRVIDETGRTPSINQVELHPYFQQAELRRVHSELGIVTEAWSPLAQGAVLEDPAIVEIAEAHGKTTGQVVIRWHMQLGNVVIPKSVTPSRIEENFDVLDFELDAAQMEAIEDLDAGRRIGPDPDVFVSP